MTTAEPKPSFRCAVVQLRSTEDIEANLATCEEFVRAAAAEGAEVVTLPENFSFLRINPESAPPAQPLDGPIVSRMAALAASLRIHLLLGSFPEATADPRRTYNTSIWLGPDGGVTATYRKIHLFDIDIPGAETHKESDQVLPGRDLVTVQTGDATFGLTVCYDLRFPELYRRLVDAGATCLTVPAAFTMTTGRDHWHVLLRARAIENQCYVIAPGQWGHHGGKRNSYGHSVIIDPWGTVLCDVPDGIGYGVARIERARQDTIRRNLPALQHRRRDLC